MRLHDEAGRLRELVARLIGEQRMAASDPSIEDLSEMSLDDMPLTMETGLLQGHT